MGVLVDGVWHREGSGVKSSDGRFKRADAQFRNWVTADGSPGPSGEGGYKAEAGRYHLYIGHACPWAHRTIIFRNLKSLKNLISVSVVHWFMGDDGWNFKPGRGVVGDSINNARFMHEIYTAADPQFSGRATIPVLWDRDRQTIVNNESSEIIRMFNTAFDGIGAAPGDYYPESQSAEIDAMNERIYHTVNNGVYRCGFATSQEAYDEAVAALFETLDWLETRLQSNQFLCGDSITEADWRLFTTLVRFDTVYHYHFKCNLRRLRDYPKLFAYTKQLYAVRGVSDTVNLEHIKNHYFGSHKTINPTGIIPAGPWSPLGD